MQRKIHFQETLDQIHCKYQLYICIKLCIPAVQLNCECPLYNCHVNASCTAAVWISAVQPDCECQLYHCHANASYTTELWMPAVPLPCERQLYHCHVNASCTTGLWVSIITALNDSCTSVTRMPAETSALWIPAIQLQCELQLCNIKGTWHIST